MTYSGIKCTDTQAAAILYAWFAAAHLMLSR